MAVDIIIPVLGESITEATILRWLKNSGDVVAQDEVLVEIETDKATMELAAPESGVLSITKGEGEKVQIGDVIGQVTVGAEGRKASVTAPPADGQAAVSRERAPAAPTPLSPAVRVLVEEHGLRPGDIAATGRGGRLTKGDVLQHLEARTQESPASVQAPSASASSVS